MSDEIRVQWGVSLWGPRAADNPEHSVGGHGDTPEEALENLQKNIETKRELASDFARKAREIA